MISIPVKADLPSLALSVFHLGVPKNQFVRVFFQQQKVVTLEVKVPTGVNQSFKSYF